MKAVISRAMKKFFAAMGLMMAAIVSLVSCQPKEIFSETRTMTITASSDLTKTTNDGMSTLWAEGDQLHVFYSNGSTYEKAGVFTLSEGIGSKTGTFTGETSATVSGAATWYAIYTGANAAAPLTPAASATEDGFIYLGRSNGITQPAYDDMARVSSSHCPMYGIAENVPASGTPAFAMKQLASVIEFDVVNKTGKSLIISSLELKELTDVAGQYLLDITGSEPVLTPVEGKTITNPVVKITNPAELAANAVAKLYIPVKPFKHTTEAGMQVVVSGKVNDAEGSKTISLNPVGDAQCTFAAGKIKKVTVNVTELDVVTPADHTFIFNTSEGLGKLGIAVPEAGGNTTLNGETFTDRASGVSISFDKGSATTDCRIWCTAGGELDLRVYNKSSMTITAPSGYSVTKIVFDGAAITGLGGVTNGEWSGKASAVEIPVSATSKINTIDVTIESGSSGPVVTDKLSVDPASLSFEAAGGSENVTVTCNNSNWTVDSSTVPTWLTVQKASASSGIIVNASANTGAARNATITLKHSNGTLTATVAVSQKSGEAGSDDVLTLGAASISFGSTDTEAKKVKVTCNSADWSVDRTTVPNWLTIEEFRETTDEGVEYYITVKAAVNTGVARSAEVTVNHPNGTLSRKLAVGQNAASTGASKTYKRVTSASALTSGEYIIVYAPETGDSFAMNGGLATLDAASNGVKVTISGDTITYKGDDVFFTYNSSEGSFKGCGGSYLAHKEKRNNIANGVTEYSEDTCKMSVTFDGDNVIITAPTSYILKYNASSDQARFRFYSATSNQKVVQLFKKN